MNIDGHVHLVGEGWIKEDFFVNLARIISAGAGKGSGVFPDPVSLLPDIRKALFETSGEKLLKEMDTAGLEHSCIFAVDYGLLTGEPPVSPGRGLLYRRRDRYYHEPVHGAPVAWWGEEGK